MTELCGWSSRRSQTPAWRGAPIWFIVVVLTVTALLVVLSYWPARNLVARRQLMNASFNRYHLVNAYGAFGTVTKRPTT